MSYMKEFGQVLLELSKEDIRNHPEKPVLRLIDDDGELLGIFDLRTSEVVRDFNLADYDIQFVQKEIARNGENWLETWDDYVEFLSA